MKLHAKLGILSGVLFVMCGLSFLGYVRLEVYVHHERVVQVATLSKETKTVTEPLRPIPRAAPVKIVIPSLHTEAPIQPVGLDAYGRMATVPHPRVIAWYTGGATPGQPGNAIFAGHRDWNGVLGTFWKLETVPIGSHVLIQLSNGATKTFTVISNHSYPEHQVPARVMQLTGAARVTLITCVGVFIRSAGGYQSRVVVELRPDG